MKSGYYYINVTATATESLAKVEEYPQGEALLQHRNGMDIVKITPANHINCADCPTKEAYERLKSLPDCNDCGDVRDCTYAPLIGEPVRNNCPLWRPEKEKEANR